MQEKPTRKSQNCLQEASAERIKRKQGAEIKYFICEGGRMISVDLRSIITMKPSTTLSLPESNIHG